MEMNGNLYSNFSDYQKWFWLDNKEKINEYFVIVSNVLWNSIKLSRELVGENENMTAIR